MPDTRLSDRGNIEVQYARKPVQATRDRLHAAGFKWHEPSLSWWAPPSKGALALAVELDPNFKAQASGVEPVKAPRSPKAAAAPAAKPRGKARAVTIGAFDKPAAGDVASANIHWGAAEVGVIERHMRDWNRSGASRTRDYGVDHYDVRFFSGAPHAIDRTFRPKGSGRGRPDQASVAAALSDAKAYVRAQLAQGAGR